MGTWGPGNLEGDGSQDTLADFCDDLFGKVITLLKHPRGHEYDDEEIDQLFVTIEVIFSLSERGMITSAPPAEELRALFPDYLERWKEYMTEEAGEIWEERQAVIERSFDRLASIAGET